MKKICSIILALVMLLLASGCAHNAEVTLSEKDYEYIDTVFELQAQWDTIHVEGGENHYINKILFEDFDGTGRLSFSVSYDISYLLGKSYDVLDDGTMQRIQRKNVYDTDTGTRLQGMLARTNAMYGVDWSYSFSDEEKRAALERAYKEYLERENS